MGKLVGFLVVELVVGSPMGILVGDVVGLGEGFFVGGHP